MNNKNPLGFEADYIKTHTPHSINKKPFIIVFILLIIIIFIATFTSRDKEETKVVQETIIQEPSVEPAPIEESILPEFATDPLVVQECFKSCTSDKNCLTYCTYKEIFDRSKAEGNIQLCDQIPNDESVQICKDSYYTDEAFKRNDITLCNKISEQEIKDLCRELIQI